MKRSAWTGDHGRASPGAAECARQDAMRRREDNDLYARMGWQSPSAAATAEPGTAPSVAAPTPSAVHTPTLAAAPTTTETVRPPLPTAPGTKGTEAAGTAGRTVTGDAVPARRGLSEIPPHPDERPIRGFRGYSIARDGTVRSYWHHYGTTPAVLTDRARIVPTSRVHGSVRVQLRTDEGRRTSRTVARMLAEIWPEAPRLPRRPENGHRWTKREARAAGRKSGVSRRSA